MSATRGLFILNVGFIVHQTIGYSREFPFDAPEISLSPDLKLYNLSGVVKVTRTAQGLLLQGKFSAQVIAECVRCLDEIYQALHTEFTELYAFNRNSVTESGLILPDNGKIDLAPIMREEMLLAIPINPLCKPDCKGLCPVCGENLNQTLCNHENEVIDPRMDALKALLRNSENPSIG
ncbi:MAG TPA: DUF177 domain-containing protein [Anaerolineales bacterium]|nr:DUF177 domain-containing protein [Anaerolineales bacterium]